MKKVLLSILAVATFGAANAQDTLIGHMAGTPTMYSLTVGGYASGHNGYGDKEEAQKFLGLSGPISAVLFWAGHVEGNQSSTVAVTIYDDNSGQPGSAIGTTTVAFGAIDTVAANIQTIGGGVMAYNATASFSTPVTIPADGQYYVSLGFTYIAGDTVGIVTSTAGDFSSASTETWEKGSNDTWVDFNTSWGGNLDVGIAIFPIVIGAGPTAIVENTLDAKVYTFGNELFIKSTEVLDNANVTIVSAIGQNIETFQVSGTNNTMNLSHLSRGVYFVQVTNGNKVITSKVSLK